MTFKESLRACFIEKGLSFKGRASRSEYWYFKLFEVIAVAAIVLLGITTYSFLENLKTSGSELYKPLYIAYLIIFFSAICYLVLIEYCVSVRRLHDMNFNALWYLLIFVSNLMFATFYLTWLFFIFKGTKGKNRFGEDPLAPPKAKDHNSEIFVNNSDDDFSIETAQDLAEISDLEAMDGRKVSESTQILQDKDKTFGKF